VFFFIELWALTLYVEIVLVIQHLLGLLYPVVVSKKFVGAVVSLWNFSIQINNIQKYYSVSLGVISIIIMFAPTS